MSGGLEVDALGFESIERALISIERASYTIGRVGFPVRERILESERRHLGAGGFFAPRKPSTLLRYRYALQNMADEQDHQSMGSGPLDRLGLLKRVLTTAQHPGQRDSVVPMSGGIDVRFGVKARGPAAYVGMQADGPGGRAKRNPFKFDGEAHRDATGDVLHHMIENF